MNKKSVIWLGRNEHLISKNYAFCVSYKKMEYREEFGEFMAANLCGKEVKAVFGKSVAKMKPGTQIQIALTMKLVKRGKK